MSAVEIVEGTAPAPHNRIDYAEIVDVFNKTYVGGKFRIPKVYNVTLFRNNLLRRGLTADDISVYQRGDHCYIQRLSDAVMN
ncbi:hypothetical protein OF001_U20331 [Pseudomonas sp. OF001]|uniref:hypothetical protein n=1 Tax=Pseudomonas sp. OF001 TaxID=2772300 RepID=UPI001917FE42|nr:hypothetical protein [Pseudomonas sp. OF001]CAD5377404.1 hypothetical protein OF001_U20331 [Pseudomonas sp. OF001]